MKSHTLKTAGIIVEYNPLHSGHIHHIQETRRLTQCDVLIAVMSPNFVQRGEPAILDKWTRTAAALNQGVDLVLELPTLFAIQSAETFARESVSILKRAGVQTIVYGSETLTKPSIDTVDATLLNQGFSYAKAKNTDQKLPNSILGAYYEHFANELNIETQSILRTNQYHETTISGMHASATALRIEMRKGHDISDYSPIDMRALPFFTIEAYYPFIRSILLSRQLENGQHFFISEGLENTLYEAAKETYTWDTFLQKCVSKRYTASRIRRSVMHLYLNTQKYHSHQTDTIRVLGMSKYGQHYLKTKKDSVLTPSFKNYTHKDFEERATLLYALPYPEQQERLLSLEKGGPIRRL